MGSIIERVPYTCTCGTVVELDALAEVPVSMAYDLATARRCLHCYLQDADRETSQREVISHEEDGAGSGPPPHADAGMGEGAGHLGESNRGSP